MERGIVVFRANVAAVQFEACTELRACKRRERRVTAAPVEHALSNRQRRVHLGIDAHELVERRFQRALVCKIGVVAGGVRVGEERVQRRSESHPVRFKGAGFYRHRAFRRSPVPR